GRHDNGRLPRRRPRRHRSDPHRARPGWSGLARRGGTFAPLRTAVRAYVPPPVAARVDCGAAGVSPQAAPREPDLAPDVAARTNGLRAGWTTGTCASAAAKAAAVGLVSGTAPAQIDVGLPSGRRVSFPVEREAPNRCAVVKDA